MTALCKQGCGHEGKSDSPWSEAHTALLFIASLQRGKQTRAADPGERGVSSAQALAPPEPLARGGAGCLSTKLLFKASLGRVKEAIQPPGTPQHRRELCLWLAASRGGSVASPALRLRALSSTPDPTKVPALPLPVLRLVFWGRKMLIHCLGNYTGNILHS